MLGGQGSVFTAGWPKYDEAMTKEDTIQIPVQVNGKVKGTIELEADADKEKVLAAGREFIQKKLNGNIVKEIYVPGKILNFVVK